MKKNVTALVLTAALILGLLAACSSQAETPEVTPGYLPATTLTNDLTVLEDEAVALAETPPAMTTSLTPKTGLLVKENARAAIDYSYTGDGYVTVAVKEESIKRWKAQVKGPTTTYTYNLTPGEQTVFPLSDGNGSYQITVYENTSGSKYAAVLSCKRTVTLKDEFGPFLYPNQYVDWSVAPNTVAKAAELTKCSETELDKVAAVYDYVIETLSYDKKLAASVKSGYLPELDKVLEKKTGICFDYAALMTGMLRSQEVPCKLVVGYAGTAYHAWISVWSAEEGWIENVIHFDGTAWQRMDPTFASSSNSDPAVMRYIGDGSNYTAKYFY